MAALGTSERGRGARELRMASNDKNTTQHHNQVGARVSESKARCLMMEGVEKQESNARVDERLAWLWVIGPVVRGGG